ncbi:tyrosine-type recombinase/integrase [Duganella sp. FT80W]|uniref:Tyrosine-type recombinase/integrase n=1 Tax=Duganella guangzhouensis TaxID=2666084 RepID=A0A6I2KSG8_9BURK|nr:tyrosine-type recombinase/integrase [Duganella guangzhouensis]MRW88391.1 tyrosine-type recombinase/integrase [Duganella guangzhouensis]
MLNNILLRPRKVNGVKTWILIGSNGREIHEFSIFAKTMQDKINTMDSYCRAAAFFIDYVIEAVHCLNLSSDDFQLSHFVLDEIIESYRDYIVHGKSSENHISMLVAFKKPPQKYSAASINLMIAARNRFLQVSEKIRKEMEQLSALGLIEADVDPLPLNFGTVQREEIDPFQKRAIARNSVIAAVVKGGAKLIRKSPRRSIPISGHKQSRAFPIDKIVPFILEQKTYRDKALYSFIGATACRISEAMQILIRDFNLSKREARFIDPNKRINSSCYRGLNAKERQKLVWKGRTDETAFFLEPFGTMFFEYAELYVRHEYIPNDQHEFFFQTKSGTPLFLDSSGTRQKNFHKSRRAIGLNDDIDGAHCIRHGVATYLINHCPRADGGVGLSLADVAYYLGHSNPKTTMGYIERDKEFNKQKIEYANSKIFNGSVAKDFNQLKIEFHESELKKLRNKVEENRNEQLYHK